MIEPSGCCPRDFTESLKFEFLKKGAYMPKGREKERELRRKYRKKHQRLKALDKTQRKVGAKTK